MKPTKSYHRYGEYWKEPSGLKRLDFMVHHINQEVERRGKRLSILEVGCGSGNISISMGSLENCSVIGIDIDAESIKKAINSNPLENVKFLCVDIGSFYYSHKFDIIICSEVLEHLETPKEMLKRMKTF